MQISPQVPKRKIVNPPWKLTFEYSDFQNIFLLLTPLDMEGATFAHLGI